jgi:hypothetical protein
VGYNSAYPDETNGQNGGDDTIDNPNIIGSLLIALGDRSSC